MTTTITAPRTLPADVYDALELSALIHGGVGSCHLANDGVPHCIIGHAMFLDGYDPTTQNEDHIREDAPITAALVQAFPRLGIENAYYDDSYLVKVRAVEAANDNAVCSIPLTDIEQQKVTWRRWCKQLNVVRGEN